MKVFITGTAGFIGFHLAKLFLSKNWTVLGIDGMTDYYDVELKNHRHQILSKSKKFIKYEFFLQDFNKLVQVVKKYKPLIVIHLAVLIYLFRIALCTNLTTSHHHLML